MFLAVQCLPPKGLGHGMDEPKPTDIRARTDSPVSAQTAASAQHPLANPKPTHDLEISILFAALVIGLVSGFLLKNQCTQHDWDGFEFRRLCYNDIQALYTDRALYEGRFPYLETDLEYPVGTGLYVGATGKATLDERSFFNLNALGLAVFATIATLAVGAMASDRRRLLLFALSPTLVLYAFHNWDLLAVGFTALALYAYNRRADGWTGALLGLGAAAKLYPAIFLPVLALTRWRETGRIPRKMVGMATTSFLLVNLPVLLANFEGWLYPWRFQSTRAPNYETHWYFFFRVFADDQAAERYGSLVALLSAALFVITAAFLIRAELRRARVRPYALCMGVLILFLLTGKVFSPQFMLWILPFFVLIGIPWYGFVAFALADTIVWIAVASFFLANVHNSGDPNFRLGLTFAAVFVRYGVLGWLLWRSRSAPELILASEQEQESHQ